MMMVTSKQGLIRSVHSGRHELVVTVAQHIEARSESGHAMLDLSVSALAR